MQSIFITTIIFFLITACAAPTVTATISPTIALTATPFFTATPTFSPEQAQQMKAVNEMIKGWGMEASEWNYSYNTETGELGVYLAKNAFLGLRGEVKLTLADGSVVDLKSSDVSFDGGDTLNLNGYKLDENGEWVEAVEPILATEAGQAATALFGVMDIDPSTYTLKEVNGVIVGTDNETSKEVFRDGKFDLRYAVENAKDLKPTDYKPELESYVGIPNTETHKMLMEYFVPFFKTMRTEFVKRTGSDPFDDKKSGMSPLMLDPDILAWGMVMYEDKKNDSAPEYLVYEENDGDINIIPIKHVSRTEILEFWVEK